MTSLETGLAKTVRADSAADDDRSVGLGSLLGFIYDERVGELHGDHEDADAWLTRRGLLKPSRHRTTQVESWKTPLGARVYGLASSHE